METDKFQFVKWSKQCGEDQVKKCFFQRLNFLDAHTKLIAIYQISLNAHLKNIIEEHRMPFAHFIENSFISVKDDARLYVTRVLMTFSIGWSISVGWYTLISFLVIVRCLSVLHAHSRLVVDIQFCSQYCTLIVSSPIRSIRKISTSFNSLCKLSIFRVTSDV